MREVGVEGWMCMEIGKGFQVRRKAHMKLGVQGVWEVRNNMYLLTERAFRKVQTGLRHR